MTFDFEGPFAAGSEAILLPDVPLRGLSTVSGASVGGVAVDYRVAPDSVSFGGWNPGTVAVDQSRDPVVEFRLVVPADAPTLSIEVSGDPAGPPDFFPDLSGTAYRGVDPYSEAFERLWLNLFRKLYGAGVVPAFVDRSGSAYVPYFKSLAIARALDISVAEDYLGDLRGDRLRAYLEQRSLLICDSADDDAVLAIRDRQIDILRARGSEDLTDELRAYLCSAECSAFMFEYLPRYLSGWTADRSSPNFSGRVHRQLNLAPTRGPGVRESDGLDSAGNVVYEERFGEYLLSYGDGLIHFTSPEAEGPILVYENAPVDVVHLRDGEASPDYLSQEAGGGLILQEPTSLGVQTTFTPDGTAGGGSSAGPALPGGRIKLEAGDAVAGARPSVSFEACVDVSGDVQWELRALIRTDDASGFEATVASADGDAVIRPDGLDSQSVTEEGLVFSTDELVSSLTIAPATRMPKPSVWYEVRLPIASGPLQKALPGIPSGVNRYCRIKPPDGRSVVRLTLEIANPFQGTLTIAGVSLGPVSLPGDASRVDAFNAATAVFTDADGDADLATVDARVREYLLPYGSTFRLHKYK